MVVPERCQHVELFLESEHAQRTHGNVVDSDGDHMMTVQKLLGLMHGQVAQDVMCNRGIVCGAHIQVTV